MFFVAIECVRPTDDDAEGYAFDDAAFVEELSAPNFSVDNLSCATNYYYDSEDDVVATVCSVNGGLYGLTGCKGIKK